MFVNKGMFFLRLSVGLLIKLIVLSFRVLRVMFVFFCVSDDIIMIGVGCRVMILCRKEMLFILGILIFSVIILGLSFLIILCVVNGFEVVFMILICGECWSMDGINICISVLLLIINVCILCVIKFFRKV